MYNFDLITPPLNYGAIKPETVRFVPLDSAEEMTLEEIVTRHPKGLEYGHLIRDSRLWPILTDSRGEILSFPPIINSNRSGKITPETTNMLIEVTGTSIDIVHRIANIVSAAVERRSAKIYSTTIHYSFGRRRRDESPSLKENIIRLSVKYTNQILGTSLSRKTVTQLLSKAGFRSRTMNQDVFEVIVPSYRVDVMHPIDLVEDLGIVYGLNNLKPRWPPHNTVGRLANQTVFCNLIREMMMGLGFQEVLTYSLSHPDKLFGKMGLKVGVTIELMNPKVQTLNCLRNWILPSLMEVLAANTHVEYPQKIFEVGTCTLPEERNPNKTRDCGKLASLTSDARAGYTDTLADLDALLSNLALTYKIRDSDHPSFIPGRVGKVDISGETVGLIGEIHPQVLENWKLENPTAGFELDVDQICSIRNRRTQKSN